MTNQQKKTTSANILRGIVYFIGALNADPKHIQASSADEMRCSIQSIDGLFAAADAYRVSVVKLLEIACHFEAALIAKGWEVARTSDVSDPNDPFIAAVATLLTGDFANAAAKCIRVDQISQAAPPSLVVPVRGELVSCLKQFIVHDHDVDSIIRNVERKVATHPLMMGNFQGAAPIWPNATPVHFGAQQNAPI